MGADNIQTQVTAVNQGHAGQAGLWLYLCPIRIILSSYIWGSIFGHIGSKFPQQQFLFTRISI